MSGVESGDESEESFLAENNEDLEDGELADEDNDDMDYGDSPEHDDHDSEPNNDQNITPMNSPQYNDHGSPIFGPNAPAGENDVNGGGNEGEVGGSEGGEDVNDGGAVEHAMTDQEKGLFEPEIDEHTADGENTLQETNEQETVPITGAHIVPAAPVSENNPLVPENGTARKFQGATTDADGNVQAENDGLATDLPHPTHIPAKIELPPDCYQQSMQWIHVRNHSYFGACTGPNRDAFRFGKIPFQKDDVVCETFSKKQGKIVRTELNFLDTGEPASLVDWVEKTNENRAFKYIWYWECCLRLGNKTTRIICAEFIAGSTPSPKKRKRAGRLRAPPKIVNFTNGWTDDECRKITANQIVIFEQRFFRVWALSLTDKGWWAVECDKFGNFLQLTEATATEEARYFDITDAAMLYWELMDPKTDFAVEILNNFFVQQNMEQTGGGRVANKAKAAFEYLAKAAKEGTDLAEKAKKMADRKRKPSSLPDPSSLGSAPKRPRKNDTVPPKISTTDEWRLAGQVSTVETVQAMETQSLRMQYLAVCEENLSYRQYIDKQNNDWRESTRQFNAALEDLKGQADKLYGLQSSLAQKSSDLFKYRTEILEDLKGFLEKFFSTLITRAPAPFGFSSTPAQALQPPLSNISSPAREKGPNDGNIETYLKRIPQSTEKHEASPIEDRAQITEAQVNLSILQQKYKDQQQRAKARPIRKTEVVAKNDGSEISKNKTSKSLDFESSLKSVTAKKAEKKHSKPATNPPTVDLTVEETVARTKVKSKIDEKKPNLKTQTSNLRKDSSSRPLSGGVLNDKTIRQSSTKTTAKSSAKPELQSSVVSGLAAKNAEPKIQQSLSNELKMAADEKRFDELCNDGIHNDRHEDVDSDFFDFDNDSAYRHSDFADFYDDYRTYASVDDKIFNEITAAHMYFENTKMEEFVCLTQKEIEKEMTRHEEIATLFLRLRFQKRFVKKPLELDPPYVRGSFFPSLKHRNKPFQRQARGLNSPKLDLDDDKEESVAGSVKSKVAGNGQDSSDESDDPGKKAKSLISAKSQKDIKEKLAGGGVGSGKQKRGRMEGFLVGKHDFLPGEHCIGEVSIYQFESTLKQHPKYVDAEDVETYIASTKATKRKNQTNFGHYQFLLGKILTQTYDVYTPSGYAPKDDASFLNYCGSLDRARMYVENAGPNLGHQKLTLRHVPWVFYAWVALKDCDIPKPIGARDLEVMLKNAKGNMIKKFHYNKQRNKAETGDSETQALFDSYDLPGN